MHIVRTKQELQQALEFLPKPLCFVPTMGALHPGHLSLVKHAKQIGNSVIVSVFVNPTQFGVNEDFDQYPRDEQKDTSLLQQEGVDIVYIPTIEEIYADNTKSDYIIGEIGNCLCGAARPNLFNGVIQVLSKFFDQIQPDRVLLGEKDYQQLQIVTQFAEKYYPDITITASPTLREVDGLAMSSRNRYLLPKERAIAPLLYKSLCKIKKKWRPGAEIVSLLIEIKQSLLKEGFSKIDYLEIRDAKNLSIVSAYKKNARIFVAAHLGNARLIDNISV